MLQRYVKLTGMGTDSYSDKLILWGSIKPLFKHESHTNRNAYKKVKIGDRVLDLQI